MSTAEIEKILFPELHQSDDRNSLFHYHKGRVSRIKGKKELSGSSYSSHSLLSAHDKASGIAKDKPESVIKVDKASSGIKSGKHLHEAANYIARNGDIDLEDENGNLLNKDQLDEKMDAWIDSQEIPDTKEDVSAIETASGKKRAADARRLIISSPRGTNPESFKKAVREFAQEVLKNKGYKYVFGMHCKSELHPNEPDHPHIHILIKSVGRDGRRLNLRKADLRQMRERFVVIARKYGIEMNATNRAVRAQDFKSKTSERWFQEKREREDKRTPEEKARAEQAKEHIRKRKAAEKNKQSQAQKWAFKRRKDELKKKSQIHPYEQSRREEVIQAIKTGQSLNEHEAVKKAKKTREQVKENLKAYAEALKKEGDVELASQLEKKAQNIKPMKTFQESVLEKVKKKMEAEKKYKGLQKDSIER